MSELKKNTKNPHLCQRQYIFYWPQEAHCMVSFVSCVQEQQGQGDDLKFEVLLIHAYKAERSWNYS